MATRQEAIEARQKLASDLPFALREFASSAQDLRQYRGALPRAIQRFGAQLPESERILLRTYECELADTILDDVCAEIARTLQLVEISYTYPEATLDELVTYFPWAPGLKRSVEWKRTRITHYLHSFVAVGLSLPAEIQGLAHHVDLPPLPFHEIAYAITPKRLEQSWRDFKEQWEWSEEFIGILTEESEISDYAEGVDYSAIPVARWLAQSALRQETEIALDLRLLAQELTPALQRLVDEWQAARQQDGYQPIAWHNVFWTLTEEYEALPLALDQREPECSTDHELAQHLSNFYPEVKSTSRPVISRRRKQLYDACAERILRRLRENFAAGEQKPAPITLESEEHTR